MCTAVCDVNSESEMNIVIRIKACKIYFLLALVHSTFVVIIFCVSLAILVMVPVEAVFLEGVRPTAISRPTLVLLLTLDFG